MTVVPQRNYWIAVVGRFQTEENFLHQGWWCIQKKAAAGDLILGYRTIKSSSKNSGIFALSEVTGSPDPNHEHASQCYPYGKQAGELFYTPTKFIRCFDRRLLLSEMKADVELQKLSCIIRNLQATTFEIPDWGFHRIISKLEISIEPHFGSILD